VTKGSQGKPLPALRPDLCRLNALAAAGLVPMFDPDRQLFCYRLKLTPDGVIREGLSVRYTVMALLGLHRHQTAGGHSSIDIGAVVRSVLRDCGWVDNIGDAGLVLWLAAQTAPEHLNHLSSELHLASGFRRYPEALQAKTMELAWFLTGLSYATLAQTGGQPEYLKNLATTTFELLTNNQGSHGFFGHQAVWGSVGGLLRGRLGSFADQVYPIYALTRFAQVFGVPSGLNAAQRCADAICHAQGSLGQWWWHYDAGTGKVIQRYPVYSVHQDGMAPMALFALNEATGKDYREPIFRGLAWIMGHNELRRDLCESGSCLIWRNIHRRGWGKYLMDLSDVISLRRDSGKPDHLSLLYESRPYHLGWLLYAFAQRSRSHS
jgi:hypothetical protein